MVPADSRFRGCKHMPVPTLEAAGSASAYRCQAEERPPPVRRADHQVASDHRSCCYQPPAFLPGVNPHDSSALPFGARELRLSIGTRDGEKTSLESWKAARFAIGSCCTDLRAQDGNSLCERPYHMSLTSLKHPTYTNHTVHTSNTK